MAEAVAERLLDLHVRLIDLYILMEAESVYWESDLPFFDRGRCSFVIQMWWLYMQGIHEFVYYNYTTHGNYYMQTLFYKY